MARHAASSRHEWVNVFSGYRLMGSFGSQLPMGYRLFPAMGGACREEEDGLMRMSARKATAVTVAVISAWGCLGAVATTAQAAASNHSPTRSAAPARPLDNVPAPSCSDNNNTVPCWEYQTWYWTYDNCNKAGTNAVDAD
ncbi:hypothetical protein [Streptomyces orinoci]|nr:hypothetical protein [Streptomyces orinoci]